MEGGLHRGDLLSSENSSTLGWASQRGVWNFLSWLSVKTRWIIPNSLDKTSCLLRGGCAANFYQASECISTGFEKGQGVKAPHQNKGNSRKTAELPPHPSRLGPGVVRAETSPCAFLLINAFHSWLPGALGPLLPPPPTQAHHSVTALPPPPRPVAICGYQDCLSLGCIPHAWYKASALKAVGERHQMNRC